MIAEKQKGGEVDMCKALEDIYNNEVQQGIEKEIEQGILKGTEENENKYDALIIALSNAGRVQEIREKDIARFRRESLGFIFQDFNLLDTLTIEENIALALTINKVSANKIDSQIQQIAAKLNITDILNKYPYQVSGGQKQRCACARAIINHPKLILADEPTGALDSHSSQMLLSTIQEMNEQMDATILMVTHDAFSASYANRILFLRDGEIYKEIMKGSSSRKEFFEQILEVLNTLGGGVNDVR